VDRYITRIAILLLLMVPTVVWALDHDNLDPNRPIAIEDAYVVPKGEIGVEGGILFSDRKQGRSRFVFQPQLIIGAFDNTQLELSSDVQTDPRSVVGDDKSGNLTVGALYNVNTETLSLPAFAARVQLGLPTGVSAKGVDTALTGVMTRSYGRWRTHVNVTRQSDLVGQRNPTGVGIGLRHQVSSRVVVDAGLGSEFIGPADRSVFFSTVGLSVGF